MNSSDFYFELSANGEQTSFETVDGVSTEPVLKHALLPGEHPFKYRLPSLPKTKSIVLKKGKSVSGSKLMQWCTPNSEEGNAPKKGQVLLYLKDASGKPLMEWTLHNAYPLNHHAKKEAGKLPATVIEDLELGYSFYTFSKR
jgi:phage tail-like protein